MLPVRLLRKLEIAGNREAERVEPTADAGERYAFAQHREHRVEAREPVRDLRLVRSVPLEARARREALLLAGRDTGSRLRDDERNVRAPAGSLDDHPPALAVTEKTDREHPRLREGSRRRRGRRSPAPRSPPVASYPSSRRRRACRTSRLRFPRRAGAPGSEGRRRRCPDPTARTRMHEHDRARILRGKPQRPGEHHLAVPNAEIAG